MTSKGLKIAMLVFVFLLILIGSVQATVGTEGCTPGYWKNHLDSWEFYAPDDSFIDVFGGSYDKTLLEALKTGGGGEKALGRHVVAALLNAQHVYVNYPMTTGAIQDKMLNYCLPDKVEICKDRFENYNENYCPLD